MACGLALGCEPRSDSAKGEGAAPSIATAPDAPSEAALIEELSAIGYLAGSEPARHGGGVTRHDPARVAPGLNLITSGHGPVALLMDMEGRVLHEWRVEFEDVFPGHRFLERAKQTRRNFWRDAVLFPNGDLIVVWELFGLFKLDRDSNVLWAVPEPAHHELHVTEAGEIVHLQAKRKMIEGIPEKRAVEDFIVVRDGQGKELRRLTISQTLRNADWLGLRRAFWLREGERGYGVSSKGLYDPLHTNSLWLLSAGEAAGLGGEFRAGDALVSMAMLDTIAILDMQKGVARWWQQGPFGMQHQPRPTPDGQIALFNNFRGPGQSSVLTLDPRTGETTSEYTGPEDEPLYSKRSGRIQFLSNGNMLVVETDGGRALELTEEHEVVWEFRSPYRVGGAVSDSARVENRTEERAGAGKVAHLYKVERVGAELTGWLEDRRR